MGSGPNDAAVITTIVMIIAIITGVSQRSRERYRC